MLKVDVQLEGLLPSGEKRLLQGVVRRAHLQRLAMRGMNARRAAEVTGYPYQTVLGIYKEPEFRRSVLGKVDAAFEGSDELYVEQRKNLTQKIDEAAEEAFEQLYGIMMAEDTPKALKIRVGQDFLDRRVDTQRGEQRTIKWDPKELAEAAKVAREMDRVIDVTPK